MTKPKKLRVPSITHHKASGRNVVYVRAEDGKRRMVYLRGRPGSAEEQRHYRQVIADYLAGKVAATGRTPTVDSGWPTVSQLAAEWLLHAERYYVNPEGRPTGEVERARYALDTLLRTHPRKRTNDFTVRDLLDTRQAMIDRGSLCRRTINDWIGRVKRLFRWGVEQGLVPGSVWHELSAVKGLAKGRSGVADNPRVEPVPWDLVEAVLPHLTPTLRSAVLVQWHTGMRPAEVLTMTVGQLDTSGEVWLYRPDHHKTSWKGKDRLVRIGPQAQDVLRPRLTLDPDAPIFSPRTATQEHRAERRANRKTPATKQTRERASKCAELPSPDAIYGTDAYRRAIHRACGRAKVARWSPHRLRHAAGTRLAAELGIETARAALGHSDLATTRRYAKAADDVLAEEAMRRLG